MAEPFLGEIRILSFNWAPHNWSLCNGQTLPIDQNTALFALLGTTYGGDGRSSFQLPDLQGRVPIHRGIFLGDNYIQGQKGGSENITLTEVNLPEHTHIIKATTDQPDPAPNYEDAYFSASDDTKPTTDPGFAYHQATNLTMLNQSVVSSFGGNQSHNNLQPSLVLSYCIALAGLFPPRN